MSKLRTTAAYASPSVLVARMTKVAPMFATDQGGGKAGHGVAESNKV